MTAREHAAENAMDDPGEIAAFHACCSDLMRRRLASVLVSARWELWADEVQARALRGALEDRPGA